MTLQDRLFCKGYTWGFFSREGELLLPQAEDSMRRLASDGLDWICIPVNAFQETFYSLTVFSMYGRTQTDGELAHAVSLAHALGLKVCLKPMVNCLDGSWRARIDFPSDNGLDRYWSAWFRSYNRFMLHYARLAEQWGCEMLCTGCEMAGMDSQAALCLDMIRQVREVYHGLLMHNVNHGDEERFPWLDAVDVIGISAYYPVTDPTNRGREAMLRNWQKILPVIEKCHRRYRRPVMFAEIGVRNEQGCTMYPWDFHMRPDRENDEREQADFYDTAMESTWDIPWFAGYFWWDWRAILPPIEEMKNNRDFTVYGKLAEQTLKKWYMKPRDQAL